MHHVYSHVFTHWLSWYSLPSTHMTVPPSLSSTLTALRTSCWGDTLSTAAWQIAFPAEIATELKPAIPEAFLQAEEDEIVWYSSLPYRAKEGNSSGCRLRPLHEGLGETYLEMFCVLQCSCHSRAPRRQDTKGRAFRTVLADTAIWSHAYSFK